MNPLQGTTLKRSDHLSVQEKADIILKAIGSKLGDRKLTCPISGEDVNWWVQEDIVAIPGVRLNEPIVPSGGAYSMATVVCSDCGYTFFVNLVVLGIAEELGLELPHA